MTPPRYITTPPTPNSLPDPLNAYAADWKAAMESGGVNEAVEFSCKSSE